MSDGESYTSVLPPMGAHLISSYYCLGNVFQYELATHFTSNLNNPYNLNKPNYPYYELMQLLIIVSTMMPRGRALKKPTQFH